MIAALGLSLGFTSCGDDPSSVGTATGRIAPVIVLDDSFISASCEPASRSNEDVAVTVTDLKLKLTSDDGSFSQEWESVNDFDETQDFKVGDYTLEAYYGKEDDNEGYSKPHFHGSQAISVHYDRTTDVALKAELKNSRVFVRYTDAFKDYMKSYSVQIVTPKGNYINMPGDETSPAYVTPGEVTVNLSFTTANDKTANIEIAHFTAVAKTEHVLTIDIEGSDAGSDAILKLLFDDTVKAQDVEIDLSDELFDTQAPEITPEGWDNSLQFDLIESSKPKTPVKVNIYAQGKIGSVKLNVSSSSLQLRGWPQEIDLADVNDAQISLLTSLGLNSRGIWKNPDVMGFVDFTDVFSHLLVSDGYEESFHTFSLQVKDRSGNLSDNFEFTVRSGKGEIEIISAAAEVGRKVINAEVYYNGTDDLKDVKFKKRNLNSGMWDDLELTEVKPVDGKPGTFTAKLNAPYAIEASKALRADFGSAFSEKYFDVTTPEFKLIVSENDVFAHRAVVTVKCDDADDALVAKNLSFTLNGNDYDNYKINKADIEFADLDAATVCSIVASSTNHEAKVQFTTENEEHLPGCNHGTTNKHSVGFANWTEQRMEGEDYSYNKGIFPNTKKCLQYLWSVEGWATMNELTVSEHGTGIGSAAITAGASYKATSGTIPANGRSTQSFASGGGAGTSVSADGHTVGNSSSLGKTKQHTGSNAALIRTVGWGSGNTAHAGTSTDQGFGTCQNMTPGELYLGKYDNGAQYGVDFTSRPAALSFWYHYDVVTTGNGDYGTAEIIVYDADGNIIASGSKHLTERSAYTQETINLTYEKGAPKAAKLSVIFRSTDKDLKDNKALKAEKTFWHTPGGNNTSGGEYVGSELYIDDVSLTY